MKFNPFVPNGIAYPGMFIGRLEEIEEIEQTFFQTTNGNPQHLMITGERGIGKTSLLNYADFIARGEIANEDIDFNFLTVSTDIAGIKSQGGIVRQIGRELRSKLKLHEKLRARAEAVWDFLSRWEILGVSYKGREQDIDPDEALDDLVGLLAQIVCSENFDGVAILLDEADSPESSAGLGEFLKICTERLAKRDCFRVTFILAGQSVLVQKLRENHESSLRIIQILDMKPLEIDERFLVVDRGLTDANSRNEEATKIDADAQDLLATFSEGYPHFLQQFSYSAFEADEDNNISRDDVLEGAVRENGAIEQLGAKFFSEMYYSKIASDDYRRVLDYMAEHGDSWLTRKEIVENCGVSEPVVNNALAALKKRDIILVDETRKGFYRLPTRSFATWIVVSASAQR